MLAAAIFAAVDVILAAVIGLSLWRGPWTRAARREEMAQRIGVTDSMSESEVQERFAQAVGSALNRVHLNSEPALRQGALKIDLYNAPDGEYGVAMELILAQTGETLAATGRIDPGYWLETITLQRALPPGEHPCIARLGFYTLNEGTFLGAAAKQILLKAD